VARYGHSAASSDVGVALELTAAALRGAARNVHTHLESRKDRGYVDGVADKSARIAESAEASRRRATEFLKA
jgi:formiminotetrahydrofolate cyclodeaminase